MTKRIMVPMMAVVALVMAITVSAFNAKEPVPQKQDVHYFQFTGDSNNELGSPAKWDDMGTTPTVSCDKTNGIVCYVQFEGDLQDFQTFVDGKSLEDLTSIIEAYRQP